MALTLAKKKVVVDEVKQILAGASVVVVADYRGLTVSEMSQLRAQARKIGVVVRVVKNTLTRRATEQTQFECLNKSFNGPIVIAFSIESPRDAALLFRDFAKDHESLQVKALAFGSELVPAEKIDIVANLPDRKEALAKLLFVMKEPIAKLVRTLAEPQAKLVRTLAAIRAKKDTA